MKNQNTIFSSGGLDALQARFGLRVAARLSELNRELPHDVTERLRFAREQALERARLARRAEAATGVQVAGAGDGAAALMSITGPSSNWWLKVASVLPLMALVAGFVLIQRLHLHSQIAAAAEIDAALLADDVPPAAYSDPGFVEFLKVPRD
ncbi:DUF3619 family protein [Piscinibacter sp.]|uniref:DUF3619 family protein n=1 Tax=Piscinibacter sp. TaxID=1903157 RepID=UPI00355AACD8